MEETALIERAARMDAAAWEALVQAHQQAVFRLAYLFTGDPDEAEDIAQEAFIKAFRAIDQMDPRRSFRAWVLGIAANLARNRLRGGRRYLAALQRFAMRDPEAARTTHPGPELQGDARALWETVRRLSLEDQQVIYLRYFLELPEDAAAAALGIAPGTVKSRLHRALKRLRERLEQEAGGSPQGGLHG